MASLVRHGVTTSKQNFALDIFKCILLNGNYDNFIPIALEFVPNFAINNKPPLAQIMAWRGRSHNLNQLGLVYRHIYASLTDDHLHNQINRTQLLGRLKGGTNVWVGSYTYLLHSL